MGTAGVSLSWAGGSGWSKSCWNCWVTFSVKVFRIIKTWINSVRVEISPQLLLRQLCFKTVFINLPTWKLVIFCWFCLCSHYLVQNLLQDCTALIEGFCFLGRVYLYVIYLDFLCQGCPLSHHRSAPALIPFLSTLAKRVEEANSVLLQVWRNWLGTFGAFYKDCWWKYLQNCFQTESFKAEKSGLPDHETNLKKIKGN